MKHKLWMFIQTLVLITSLVATAHPGIVSLASEGGNDPIAVAPSINAAEGTDDSQQPEQFGVTQPAAASARTLIPPLPADARPAAVGEGVPNAAPPAQPDDAYECGVNAAVGIYRVDPGFTPDPSLFPVTRPVETNSGNGWDQNPLPSPDPLPRPGTPANNNWDLFPGTLPPPRYSQWNPAMAGNPPPLIDVRIDPRFNYTALRGEQLVALVVIRNTSVQFGTSCNATDVPGGGVNSPSVSSNTPEPGMTPIAAGDGQNFVFKSIHLEIRDGTGAPLTDPNQGLLSFDLTPEDFFNTYFPNMTLDQKVYQGNPSPGLLERRANTTSNPADPEAFKKIVAEDYVALIPFTVPENATGYLEAFATNWAFNCTYTGGGCPAPTATGSVVNKAARYYVSTLGGPWLYQDGDANAEGFPTNDPAPPGPYDPYLGFDPFEVTHLVGGQNNRSEGDFAWFVVEVKNKWPAAQASGTDTRSIKSITQIGGSPLSACDGNNGIGAEGWYSSVTVDRDLGVISGTKVADATNLQLGGQEAVYCVFRKQLNTGGTGVFNFSATLQGTAYTTAVEVQTLTIDFDVNISVTVAKGDLRVEKRIVSPLTGNPPEPDLVRPGDTVVYEITLTNIGEVPLDTLSFNDSLTGPFVFDPAITLDPPDSIDPFSCSGNCSASIQVQYVVQEDDPNPIFNTVVGSAEIVNTDVEITDFDSASIIQADAELQIILTATGNVNTIPVLGQDTFVTYSMTYFNNSDLPFTAIRFVELAGTEAVPPAPPDAPFYPKLQDPGSIDIYLPNYPAVEVYSETPPTGTSTLIIPTPSNPFNPGGTFPPVQWDFTLPVPPADPSQPFNAYPLFQEVVLEATRSDGTTVIGRATLITPVDNPNADIRVKLIDSDTGVILYDPLVDPVAPTVLRNETLSFEVEVEHLSPTDRCDVFVRLYKKDPNTGLETLVDPDVFIDYPTTPNTLPGAVGGIPVIVSNVDVPPPNYAEFLVEDTAPDPLVLIFEFDARTGCTSPANDNAFLIDRAVVVFDVSNINIDRQLLIVTGDSFSSTTQVTSGVYPFDGDQTYQILYRADNNGPINPEIIDLKYCIIMPAGDTTNLPNEQCSSPTGGVSMLGDNQPPIPPFPANSDFGVQGPFGDPSRIFTTATPRTDRRMFTLFQNLPAGSNYPNPLIIQVILEVTDTGNAGDVTTIRDFIVFPLSTDDLQFDLDSTIETIVRGDFGIPITFSFTNTLTTNLLNVSVLNLMNLVTSGGGTMPAISQVTPLGQYKFCTFNAPGNPTVLASMAPNEVATGTCLFDFTTDVIWNDFFTASVIGTEQGTNRPVFDLGILEMEDVPHLDVDKVGSASVLNSQPVEYTVTVTNNSKFQYVDFENNDGFTDLFEPLPSNSTLCIVSGNPTIPAGSLCNNPLPDPPGILMQHFAGLQNTPAGTYGANTWRLLPSISENLPRTATITYRLLPIPFPGGSHGEEEYSNQATLTGTRQYNPATVGEAGEILVSGSDDHVVELQCPIQWTMNFAPRGPGYGEDSIFTLGEEVAITVQARNYSDVTVFFDELLDPRYAQDTDQPGLTPITFRDEVTWPSGFQYQLPPFDPVSGFAPPLTYSFFLRLDTTDFLALPNNVFELKWAIYYTTSNLPNSPGCSFSTGNVNDEDNSIIFSIPVSDPLKIVKTVDVSRTPPPILVEGEPIKYVIEAFNISETTDLAVDFFHESLFDRDLIVAYCNAPPPLVPGVGGFLVPQCASSTEAVSGTFWRYEQALLSLPDIRPATALANPTESEPVFGGLPLYLFDKDDLLAPNAETLINRASVQYSVLSSSAPWITPNTLAYYYELEVLVVNPLEVTEEVITPADKIVSRPGTITYFVTVTNTSSDIDATNLVLTNINPNFVYPICGVTPPFDNPIPDLDVTPFVCLEQMPFNLSPGESVSVLVNYPVLETETAAVIVTQSQLTGNVVLDGVPYPFDPPPVVSQVNEVVVEKPLLLVKQQVYADAACTTPLVNVTTPDRDRNNDGTPEMEVGGKFYLGIAIISNAGRIYDDVTLTIDMFNGNVLLTNAANQALLTEAQSGNPFVTLNPGGPAGGSDIRVADNTANGAPEAEAFLCIPEPPIADGFTVTSKQPDPLIINTTIQGIESPSGDLSIFTTKDEPLITTPPAQSEVGKLVEKNIVVDITDPNIFISKTVEPTSAFPDEIVTYTITIQNLTTKNILIQDVYDSNIGVGQQFFDYDGNPFTPPEPLRYHDLVVPGLSSIPFDQYQSTDPNGLGWSWTPGNEGILPPNGTITYIYERLITDIDPNPLENRAGVLGFIDNIPPDPDIEVSDETINELLVSDSQLNVVKEAIPTATVLGTTIFYRINITNIGDDPVYDLIVWDDRYNLQHIANGYISLIPNNPANPNLLIIGGHFFIGVAGQDDAKIDLGGQQSAVGIPRSLTIEYNLPTPPACVEWAGAPNQPFDPVTNTPTVTSNGTCGNTFTNPIDLPLIDPFINNVYATGLIDDGTGNLVYLDRIGGDQAIVDIINPDMRVDKIASVSEASIGSDVEYTIRITNTGDDPLRIDEVIDQSVPSTDTGDLPLDNLTFEDCPVPNGVTTTPSVSNLEGTLLLPFITNGANPTFANTTQITLNQTSVLFPGCSAVGTILITIPNPLPANEYVNIVQANATNLISGGSVVDLTSATINVTATGLEIVKRAWDCNTVDPNNPALQPAGCTPLTRQLVTQADEGQTVYYEIVVLNSGTERLTSLQFVDNNMVDLGNGLEPLGTRIPDGTVYTDAKGNDYFWSNGTLILGIEDYRGKGQGTCGSDNPNTPDDESYDCEPNYFGFNNGPFGVDDSGTDSFDESYLFEPGEELERPEPGPVAIPAITYAHIVSFPEDDLDNDDRYVNRVRITGTPLTAGIPDLLNSDDYILEIRPATVDLQVQACVEDDGDPTTFDPDMGNPCVNVARPDQDVWYRITITSEAFVELENITVFDTVRGAIPVNLSDGICWVTPPLPGTPGWPAGTAGILNPGETVVCTYKRGDVVPALPPLQVSNDPYTNTVTVNFDIDPGVPPLLTGTPVSASATIRIALNEMLVTVEGCLNQPIQVPSGSTQIFDVTVENLDTISQITNINVLIPEPVSTQNIPVLQPSPAAGSSVTLPNALQIQVPTFGPSTIDYIVLAQGYLQNGTPGGEFITSAFICTIQRVDGSMVVTKDAIDLATGGTFARVGDTIRYTISVQNLNAFAPIINFNITDLLLENVPQTSPLVDWDTAWGLNQPNPAIAAGATVTQSFEYVVPGDTDPIINTVTATGDVAGITPVTSTDTARIDVAEGDIVVTAYALPNPVVAGNSIVFTYRICNVTPTNGTVYNIFTLEDGDPSGIPLQTGLQHPNSSLQLGGQECAFYQRTVPTTLADAGTTITRTLFAQGCPVGEIAPCPQNSIVSDGQIATVTVIEPPSNTGIIDVRLTANRLGVAIGDTVNYTVTITNLNTVHPAFIEMVPPTSQLGVFSASDPLTNHPLHNYTIQPLNQTQQTRSYFFTGLSDPLTESITIRYTINGVTGTVTATLTLPVISVAGSEVFLQIRTLQPAGTPGGQLTYEYTVTNIGSSVVYDAYIYNPYFFPPLLDINDCSPVAPGDIWVLGNPLDTDPTPGVIYPVPAQRFVPPIFPNGFSRTGRMICNIPVDFPLNPPTNLVHGAWLNVRSVNAENADGAVQDKESITTPIVPPLQVTMQQAGVAVPGGPVDIQFTVTNIGPSAISGVRLFAFPVQECQTNWVSQTPAGAGSLWSSTGATIGAGSSTIAHATCNIPVDFLNGLTADAFPYPAPGQLPVTVQVQGIVFDTADPILINVVDPVLFEFIPPSNNPTLQFVRANDPITLTFRLYNTGPAGFAVESLSWDINIGTDSCDTETATFANGTPFIKGSSTLDNNGDYVQIVCTYTPDASQHGQSLEIHFDASYVVNGTIVDVQIPDPVEDINGDPYLLLVEDVNMDLTLTANVTGTPKEVDDLQKILFDLTITNTGQTPLTNFNFSENMIDTFTGQTVPGKDNIFGDLNSLATTECTLPLPAGGVCTIDDLPYTVQLTDPQQFTVRVFAEGVTSTGSGFTVFDTAEWQGVVRRPVLELPGPAYGVFTNASGLVWITVPGNIGINPNPAIIDQTVTITVTLKNSGFADITGATLTGTINPPSTAGITLTSGAGQTPPAALKFTLPSATILPGQVVTASATWTATGVTPPATVYLTLNFKGEVEGIYPPYDITTAPMPILVNPEPAIAGTTVDGLTLDPNATEPVITKSSSVPSAFPGEEVAWTITITNLWTQEMASVALTDAVPGDLVVQSASTTAGASIVNENLVDVTTGPLQPGQRVTVTILTTVSETAIIPGIVTNVACGAREEGTEVCAEAVLALGPGGPLPPAGFGSPVSSLQSRIPLSDHLPFAIAIFGVFFGMLMVSMNNRQRAMLAVLALVVVIALVGIVLILAGGEGGETPERPSQLDGSPPPQAFNTATPIPTEVAEVVTSTPEPTIAPDVLATLASFPATATPYIPPTPAGPRRLDIPVLNYAIPLPIVELPQINGEWDVTNLGHNIGWLDNTTWLDPTWGNTVMVGHIQLSETDPGPFHDLDKLVPGDEIHVLEGSNISVYKVTDIFTVDPTDNTVTHPTNDPILTLITCTNWSDNRGVFADRLVVQAVPAEDFGG